VVDRRVDEASGERRRFRRAIVPPCCRGSPRVTPRLTATWRDEQRRFAARDLSGADYVYIWVDGVQFTVPLDSHRVCTPVVLGVRADRKKKLVALPDRHPESTVSWADLLREGKRRGMADPGARDRRPATGPRCGRCSRRPGSSWTWCTR
jgi:Transposase, Mutator family